MGAHVMEPNRNSQISGQNYFGLMRLDRFERARGSTPSLTRDPMPLKARHSVESITLPKFPENIGATRVFLV